MPNEQNYDTLPRSARLATRFMGWTLSHDREHWSHFEGRFEILELIEHWNPFKHLDDAAECEEKLIDVNLVESYTAKLCDLIEPIEGVPATFQLITATARQRAEAIWAVLKDKGIV